jgi:hypothetical protein
VFIFRISFLPVFSCGFRFLFGQSGAKTCWRNRIFDLFLLLIYSRRNSSLYFISKHFLSGNRKKRIFLFTGKKWAWWNFEQTTLCKYQYTRYHNAEYIINVFISTKYKHFVFYSCTYFIYSLCHFFCLYHLPFAIVEQYAFMYGANAPGIFIDAYDVGSANCTHAINCDPPLE